MPNIDNKTLVGRWYDTHQPGRIGDGEALMSDDFQANVAGMPGPLNRDAFKEIVATFLIAFSEIQQTIDTQVSEGEWVATRGTWRARHTGEFQGISSSGKWVQMAWMSMDRVLDGRIVEHWTQHDILGLLQQIGAAPGGAGPASGS